MPFHRPQFAQNRADEKARLTQGREGYGIILIVAASDRHVEDRRANAAQASGSQRRLRPRRSAASVERVELPVRPKMWRPTAGITPIARILSAPNWGPVVTNARTSLATNFSLK